MISTTEAAFFADSLCSIGNPSIRSDGRTPYSYRPINLIDQVSLQSNGSARCQLKTSSDNIITDVIVGCKLEVEQREFDIHGARIECSVDLSVR
jgi:exosome complex RNA-binding protein Rrp42 (RNase PH superfamily)